MFPNSTCKWKIKRQKSPPLPLSVSKLQRTFYLNKKTKYVCTVLPGKHLSSFSLPNFNLLSGLKETEGWFDALAAVVRSNKMNENIMNKRSAEFLSRNNSFTCGSCLLWLSYGWFYPRCPSISQFLFFYFWLPSSVCHCNYIMKYLWIALIMWAGANLGLLFVVAHCCDEYWNVYWFWMLNDEDRLQKQLKKRWVELLL